MGKNALADGFDWPGPTPDELESPMFEAIWQVIKGWDISVSDAYEGYCEATGNHVVAITRALNNAAIKILSEK